MVMLGAAEERTLVVDVGMTFNKDRVDCMGVPLYLEGTIAPGVGSGRKGGWEDICSINCKINLLFNLV